MTATTSRKSSRDGVEIMITLRLADEKTLRVTNKEKRSLFTNGAKIKYDKIFVL
jgi:hypothetical protein